MHMSRPKTNFLLFRGVRAANSARFWYAEAPDAQASGAFLTGQRLFPNIERKQPSCCGDRQASAERRFFRRLWMRKAAAARR